MSSFLIYLMEVSFCSLIFFLLYFVLLKHETFFKWNRAYLNSSILLSFIIPLLQFKSSWIDSSILTYNLPALVVLENGENSMAIETAQWNLSFYLAWAYKLIFSLMALKLVLEFNRHFRLIQRFGYETDKGLKIVSVPGLKQVHSFFNFVCIPSQWDLPSDDAEQILLHERVHIRQGHFFDLLILSLAQLVCWFNPIWIFYRSAIKDQHEFLADQAVVEDQQSLTEYTRLILEQSHPGLQLNLSNYFNHSPLKNRIKMLTKTKSSFQARLKFMACLPLIGLLFFLFSCEPEELHDQKSVTYQVKTEDGKYVTVTTSDPDLIDSGKYPPPPPPPPSAPMNPDISNAEEVFIVVEEMPTFPGGQEKMIEYIYNEVTYPAQAKDQGLEGLAVVAFVVNKSGGLEQFEVKRDPGGGMGAEALRVVQSMPDWNPGKQRGKIVNVRFNMPVRFKLAD